MNELLRQLSDLRDKCIKYHDEVNNKLGTDNEIKAGCFSMIHNNVIMTFELLNFYKMIWENPEKFGLKIPRTNEDLERTKKENAERIIEATKCLFIKSLSSIEYCAKETIKDKKHPLHSWYQKQKSKNGRIYLSGIANKSYKKGLIDEQQKECWDCLIYMRNIIVHNNGIADDDKKYRINDLEIIFEKDKMTRGNLDTFVKLTDIAVDLYHCWISHSVCGEVNKNGPGMQPLGI